MDGPQFTEAPAPGVASAGPLPAYRAKLAAGELGTDPAQRWPPSGCRRCGRGCAATTPPAGAGGRAALPPAAPQAGGGADEDRPNGLYLVGEVGRGKSMLMDLFFAAAEVRAEAAHPLPRFMQEAHARMHRLEAREPGRRRPDPAAGRPHRGRGGAALLRRVPGQRHRRRDDPRPAVRGAVRARRGGGRDLQHAARRPVRGQARARRLPAVHRAASSSIWTCW